MDLFRIFTDGKVLGRYRRNREEAKMMKVGRESQLTPVEIIEKARAFFGPAGLGLPMTIQGDGHALFDGPAGFVVVLATASGDTKGSQVTIEGHPLEQEVKEFLRKL